MRILDGKTLAAEIRLQLKAKIQDEQLNPALAVVLVGEDPASQIYVRNKIKACGELGIRSFCHELPETATQKEVEDVLDELAANPEVNGILLQLPLPKGLNVESATSHIPFEKDVDGFSAENLGLLLLQKERTVACTPLGVMKILEHEGVEIAGKNAVVLGRSDTVGKPMAMLLLNANATVTICHSKTQNLKEICKNADILVSAIGKAKFVTADMVKDGAVVVDVGINRDENGKI